MVNTDYDCMSGIYTLDTYQRVLKKYERYTGLIGALEFSHVDRITPEEGKVIGDLARKIGFDTWSIHSEHLNVGDTLEHYLEVQKHEAEVCAALGCQVMVCHLPNLVPYVDFERDLDVIGPLYRESQSILTDNGHFPADTSSLQRFFIIVTFHLHCKTA